MNHLSYLNNLDDNVFHFHDTDVSIVEQFIDNFPSKNSCGYDGISLRLLKFCKLTIIKPLMLIIRQVLNTGIFPEKLKIAKVIPIFKKEMKNYLVTTDPYLFYQQFPRLLKSNLSANLLIFSTE